MAFKKLWWYNSHLGEELRSKPVSFTDEWDEYVGDYIAENQEILTGYNSRGLVAEVEVDRAFAISSKYVMDIFEIRRFDYIPNNQEVKLIIDESIDSSVCIFVDSEKKEIVEFLQKIKHRIFNNFLQLEFPKYKKEILKRNSEKKKERERERERELGKLIFSFHKSKLANFFGKKVCILNQKNEIEEHLLPDDKNKYIFNKSGNFVVGVLLQLGDVLDGEKYYLSYQFHSDGYRDGEVYYMNYAQN